MTYFGQWKTKTQHCNTAIYGHEVGCGCISTFLPLGVPLGGVSILWEGYPSPAEHGSGHVTFSNQRNMGGNDLRKFQAEALRAHVCFSILLLLFSLCQQSSIFQTENCILEKDNM